jgi:hypothetical protein
VTPVERLRHDLVVLLLHLAIWLQRASNWCDDAHYRLLEPRA